ncbi:MAG: hypothetical protein LRY41_02110 [Candidatus Pacebacteria bacterium]|nr:hypothetical protein [Candidatus Paceibacterota bacterium]MCD8528101.1 hypothetical protein [Candidatus Paceibacterota bacterium]
MLKQFAQGEHFTLTNGSGAKWNIHLTNMMREDGSGKKFIFKGTLCSTVSPTGNIINKGNTIACEGFVDMATQKGTLKFLPKKNG